MTTDVQRFSPPGGRWLKPAGAMTVHAFLRGGDGGPCLTEDGVTPGELAEMIAATLMAEDLPDSLGVDVGYPNGEALIVTEVQEAS